MSEAQPLHHRRGRVPCESRGGERERERERERDREREREREREGERERVRRHTNSSLACL